MPSSTGCVAVAIASSSNSASAHGASGFGSRGGSDPPRRVVPRAWSPIAEVFAFSAESGLLASEVRSMDDTHEEVAQHLDVTPPAPEPTPDTERDRERPPDTARLFRRPSRRA
jgi:hypothetical protein